MRSGFHPWHFIYLSDKTLTLWVAIMLHAEKQLDLPSQMRISFMFFLDKPDGGKRPIGLFDSSIRLWGALRRPISKEWERQWHRSYFSTSSEK